MLDQFRAQKLEWNRANNQIYDRVETSSGDSNGRTLFVQISNGGTVEDLTGATLSLAWNKKTEQGLESFEEVDAKKGQYRLFYPTGMLVNHGVLQASLVLVDVTGRIESKPFVITVHKGTVDDEAVESDNKFTALTTALVKVSQVQAEFDDLYADKSQMMDTLHDEKKADMEVLEADYSNRANTLEATYAPRLTEAESEIDVARGGARTLGERLDESDAQLAQKAGKGEVGSPLTADSVNDMTDTSRVYVNSTDGSWYSYNGTEWVIGGTYNSEGLGKDTVRPIHLTHEIKSDITENQSVNLSIDDNSFWNSKGSRAVKEAFTGFYRSTEIDVYPGESVTITIQVGTSSKQRGIVVTDDSYTILWKYDSVGTLTQVDNYELTIPTNGTKLLLTDYYFKSILEVKKDVYVGIASKSYVHNIMDNLSNTEDLSGQTFSVLGDSTSAYIGHIPEGNAHYYNGSNSGVSDVSEMWWSVLASKTGMIPLVINAWSGSKVSNIDLENNGFKPASVLSRAAGLHVGVNKPDNIIIKMGINDFSKSGAVIGTWSGGSSLPPANNDFSTAYAMMLSRIREAYPDSKIYCVSLGIFVRTNTDKNGVEYNGEGKTVYDYNEVIRKMCDLFGATYVDTQNIGITRQNIYPTYAEDYSSIPTHYNAAGHLLLGESVAKKITQP